MFAFILILPGVFFLVSSYLFNKNKLSSKGIAFWRTTLLEATVSYMIALMILHKLLYNKMFIFLLLIILILIFGLLLFWNSKVTETDSDIETETIKNNLILFFTTYAPFILFLVIFHNLAWFFSYPLSLVLATIVFATSLLLKKLIEPLYIWIQNRLNLVPDYVTMIIYGVFLICLSISLFVVPFVFHIYPDIITDSETTYFFSGSDSKVDTYKDKLVLYSTDQDTSKNFIRFYDTVTQSPTSTIFIDYDYSDISFGLYTNPRVFQFNDSMVLTTNSGAYLFQSNNANLISETANLPVYYTYTAEHDYLLVDQLDGTYKIYNDTLAEIDSIDTNDVTGELELISDCLFIKTDTTYTDYFNQTLTFTNHNGEAYYDPFDQIMYSYVIDSNGKTMTIYKEHTSGHETVFETTKSNSTQILNLYGAYYYNKVEIFNTTFSDKITDNIKVVSIRKDDDWVSYLEYDNKVRFRGIHPGEYSIGAISNDADLPSSMIIHYLLGNFKSDVDQLAYSYISAIFGSLIVIAFLIPMTNYRKDITVIDSNTPFKEGK